MKGYAVFRTRTNGAAPINGLIGVALTEDRANEILLEHTPTDRRIEWKPEQKQVDVYHNGRLVEVLNIAETTVFE